MNRVHASSQTNKLAEARDALAVVNQDRELRALARKLAAYACWQAAEYRVLQDVKDEKLRATPLS
jgi:hypothetical protein